MNLPGPRQPDPDPGPRPGRTVPQPRQPEAADWAEDLAHGALVGFTVTHLREARAAALAAEQATVQFAYITLARDLAGGGL